MQTLRTAVIACILSATTASAQTGVNSLGLLDGPFVNCAVQNDTGRNILVTAIRYELLTTSGTRYRTISCVTNCGLFAGNGNRFSGPPNNPSINFARCLVRWVYV